MLSLSNVGEDIGNYYDNSWQGRQSEADFAAGGPNDGTSRADIAGLDGPTLTADFKRQIFGGCETPERLSTCDRSRYTENELPHPQLPVELGLLNVNPEPMTEFT